MNQIIYSKDFNSNVNSNIYSNTNNKKKNLLKLEFFIFVLILIFLCIYYAFFRYDLYSSEKISETLLDSFTITSLYPNTSNYSADLINQDLINSDNINASVIGTIEIKKINIIYPILSDLTKELLKISPCKFYGPAPNRVGNLCIAAHNYKNDTFFSNLSDLKNGDIITIYDTNGTSIDYIVYDIYTSKADDLSSINQNTNGLKIVTLVTCNTFDNHYRTIVKAKEF